jgi:hypothetical protein
MLLAGIALTSLGCVVLLPGGFYSYEAYRAWKAHGGYSEELMAIR